MEKEDGRVEKDHSAINMKANTKTIKSMDTECSYGKVAIVTKENIRRMKEMVMERCSGLMAALMLENG